MSRDTDESRTPHECACLGDCGALEDDCCCAADEPKPSWAAVAMLGGFREGIKAAREFEAAQRAIEALFSGRSGGGS